MLLQVAIIPLDPRSPVSVDCTNTGKPVCAIPSEADADAEEKSHSVAALLRGRRHQAGRLASMD